MPTMPTYGGKGGLMTRILRYMYKLQTTGVPWVTLYTLYNKSLLSGQTLKLIVVTIYMYIHSICTVDCYISVN